MKRKYDLPVRKIRSMEDLRIEKMKIRMEIANKEEQILHNYRFLKERLSLRHLTETISADVQLATTAFSKAFSLGKTLFGKIRKKKEKGEKHKGDSAEGTPSTAPETGN
jgi:hypothetical protein